MANEAPPAAEVAEADCAREVWIYLPQSRLPSWMLFFDWRPLRCVAGADVWLAQREALQLRHGARAR